MTTKLEELYTALQENIEGKSICIFDKNEFTKITKLIKNELYAYVIDDYVVAVGGSEDIEKLRGVLIH